MELDEIRQRIENGIAGATAIVTGDGCNCAATVISDEFKDKTLLNKQKMVMATVSDLIGSGELHALSIKTFTHGEWESR